MKCLVLGTLALVTACAGKEKPKSEREGTAPPKPVATIMDAATAPPAEVAVMDAAPTAPVDPNAYVLDLDGDGVDERVSVRQTSLRIDDTEMDHGLGELGGRHVVASVIDIDSTDARKELLIFVSDYEALGWISLVYNRGGEHVLSKVIHMQRPNAKGDGFLHTESWFQGKKTLLTYEISDTGIVRTQKAR